MRLATFIFFAYLGTDTQEKIIVALEKTTAETGNQLYGLKELAFTSMELAAGLDSTELLILPKHFSDYNLNATSMCKPKCLNKLRQRLNICRRVAPQNRQDFENIAFGKYEDSIGDCV